MFIETDYFGKVEVKESETITFVSEIPGFPDSKTFVLIPYEMTFRFGHFSRLRKAPVRSS